MGEELVLRVCGPEERVVGPVEGRLGGIVLGLLAPVSVVCYGEGVEVKLELSIWLLRSRSAHVIWIPLLQKNGEFHFISIIIFVFVIVVFVPSFLRGDVVYLVVSDPGSV